MKINKNNKILIVEDESIVAQDIDSILKANGYNEVDIVWSGPDALKADEKQVYGIILMDIMLSGPIDGIETVGEINKRFDIPILFLTAHSDVHIVEKARLANPYGYILKPFNERELIITIDMIMQRHFYENKIKKEEKKYQKKLERIVKERTSELERSKGELRNMYEHLESVREDERIIMAREIHDELGQALSVLNMDISLLKKRIKDNTPAIGEKIDSMSGMVENLIDRILKITSDLRPVILDELGVIAAIEWYTGEISKRSDIKFKLAFNFGEFNPDVKISLSIFRILQESITNIIRHANASYVWIDLYVIDDSIKLDIRDNGIGISIEKINHSQSFGILGMKERVYSHAGDIKINGSKNRGTSIKVSIPIKEQDKNHD